MSINDKLPALFSGIEVIEQIAKQALGGEAKAAFEALHIIAMLVGTLRDGLSDKIAIEDVETEIKNLRKTILDQDAAADAALEHKFDKSDS